TSVLGWTFLAMVAATFFYFNRDGINARLRAILLQLRMDFLRHTAWFMLLALVPFIVAMIMRNSFHWLETPALMAFGYLLLGLLVSAWLLFASHYDQEFGDIEKKENSRRMSRWNLVRSLMAGSILLFCIGMAFKYFHLSGADEMIMIGASAV